MTPKDSMKKGTMEMLILSLLKQHGDMYGYQISQEIVERSNESVFYPEGSLYPALYRLTDSGYISCYSQKSGPRMTRNYYHIEPSGNEYLNLILEDYFQLTRGIFSILGKPTDF